MIWLRKVSVLNGRIAEVSHFPELHANVRVLFLFCRIGTHNLTVNENENKVFHADHGHEKDF